MSVAGIMSQAIICIPANLDWSDWLVICCQAVEEVVHIHAVLLAENDWKETGAVG